MTLVLAEAAGKRSHGILVRHASALGIDVQEIRTRRGGSAVSPARQCFGARGRTLPGSEGGLDSQRSNAELLASHGCATLVAATFAGDGPPVAGLPLRLERVPLERFADAIRWLADHDRVDASRVTAMAISRGSEGLLATASRIDDLEIDRRSLAVVGDVGRTR